MEDDVGREDKLVFVDGDGKVRALRGTITFQNGFVQVARRDGVFTVPLHRVVQVEQWAGERP